MNKKTWQSAISPFLVRPSFFEIRTARTVLFRFLSFSCCCVSRISPVSAIIFHRKIHRDSLSVSLQEWGGSKSRHVRARERAPLATAPPSQPTKISLTADDFAPSMTHLHDSLAAVRPRFEANSPSSELSTIYPGLSSRKYETKSKEELHNSWEIYLFNHVDLSHLIIIN